MLFKIISSILECESLLKMTAELLIATILLLPQLQYVRMVFVQGVVCLTCMWHRQIEVVRQSNQSTQPLQHIVILCYCV